MLFFLVGGTLVTLASFLMLGACIWHVIQAFQDSTKWGILVILGYLCLFNIPNLIFVFRDIKNNGQPLLLFFGMFPPMVLGTVLLVSGMFISAHS
jgi:hypothetical protein